MQVEQISSLKDQRTDCISVLYQSDIDSYLEFVDEAYQDKGGLEQQREPLKTSSAIRIRKRMIHDIKQGTVLPPIVIGLIVSEKQFIDIPEMTLEQFNHLLQEIDSSDITIIDGMQRTTALLEANESGIKKQSNVRVEFWITTTLNSLIYRMLVLNTGQVPWNLRRQIEVVFRSMIKEMKDSVPEADIYEIDDGKRRSQPGQYHANQIIELYLVFGGRKEKVDTKERLADEFTRLDFIEATEDKEFTNVFYEMLNYLAKIDKEFSKSAKYETDGKFSEGQDLFKSQPARVGFTTSIAKKVLGRPGTNIDKKSKEDNWNKIKTKIDTFLKYLERLSDEEMKDFLRLDVLNEKLAVQVTRIGDYERAFFTKSFDALIEEKFDVENLELCWRAY